MTPTCPLCERPVSDASFCTTCATGLLADLTKAQWLTGSVTPRGGVVPAMSELDVTVTRQARIMATVGSRSTETPLPWHEKASTSGRHLHAVLVSWALLVVEEREVQAPTDATVAQWLSGHVEWLRHHPAGVEALREIHAAVDGALRVIDRPVEQRWLGLCEHPTDAGPCPYSVLAEPGEHYVTCRACGAVHDTEARRDRMLAAVDDQLSHASLIASALSGLLGQDVKPDLLRKWAERGRLIAHGVDSARRPLYRVGDVLDLLRRRSA